MKRQICAAASLWLCVSGMAWADVDVGACGGATGSIRTGAPKDSVSDLNAFLSEAGGKWLTTAAAVSTASTAAEKTTRETALKSCTDAIDKALKEAAKPEVARLGGDGLLGAASDLKDTLSQTTDMLATIPVNSLVKAGLQKIAEEQKIDPSAARYDFYAGPSFALTPDGSWNNGAEIMFRSNTGRLVPFESMGDRWYLQISSLFDYRALGGDKDVNLEGGSGDGSGGSGSGSGDTGFVSPFDAKGGVASVDLRFAGLAETGDKKSAFGLAVMGGAESLPLKADDGALTTLKARGGLGPLYRTSYSDGALGELFVGYIHDTRYKAEYTGEDKDSMERIALSGILQLPSFNKEGSLRLAARIFASTPISGGNASELRLSVLVAYDLRSIFAKL